MGKIGFIVSSDGAKSSYEIGCLKAIKELGSEITCVSGAFAGTINAMLIAQNDIQNMVKFWRNASKEGLFDAINAVSHIYVNEWEILSGKDFFREYLDYINSSSRLLKIKNLLSRHINEETIRNSEITPSIIAISPEHHKFIVCSVNDIPEGKLVDYVYSSVLYPTISVSDMDIVGKITYEISPYKAIEMFSPALVLSTDDMSRVPTPSRSRLKIKLITPTEMVDFSFRESADEMIKAIRLGHMDTLKKVSFSYGSTYYINRLIDNDISSLRNRINSSLPGHLSGLVKFLLRTENNSPDVIASRLKAMLRATGIKDGDMYVALTENAAGLLGVDKNEKYTDKSLREKTVEKMKELCEKNAPDLSMQESVRKIINDAKENAGSFVSGDLLSKYFLILFATAPENYPALKDFCGSLHLKTILAIVVMIYFVY